MRKTKAGMVAQRSPGRGGSGTQEKRNSNIQTKGSQAHESGHRDPANIRSIVHKRSKVRTTDSNHDYPVTNNLLNRDFSPSATGKVWVSDITYIKTLEGWLYLTTIVDLGDRKVIGWALSQTMKTCDTVIPAWKMAINNRTITTELIFHRSGDPVRQRSPVCLS